MRYFATMLVGLTLAVLARAQSADALIKQATEAWGKRDHDRALELLDKAIQAEPKKQAAYYVRGSLHEARADDLKGQAMLDAYAAAVQDFTRLIELAPDEADGYHSRGGVRFKLGQVDASLQDFDKFLTLRPDRRASHWQRGITCYYAGRYEEGKKQFEGYQDFDANDVENAIWRFLCMAKPDGLEKARGAMLKIGPDRRVPMREIYDLYLGRLKAEDVLNAARAGDPPANLLNRQLFYAHLYLGIWYDLLGDRTKALEHLDRAAVEHRIRHYMWDVARVHRDRLRASAGK